MDPSSARWARPADLKVVVVEGRELQCALLAGFLGGIGLRSIPQALRQRHENG